MKQAINSLDKYLAVATALFSVALIISLYVLFPSKVYKYVEIPAISIIASLFYVVIARRHLSLVAISTTIRKHSVSIYLISQIVFIIIFTYSIASFMEAGEPYSRPLGYFISIVVLVGLTAVEIILNPLRRLAVFISLVKIFLLAVIFRLAPLLVFPEIIGIDPFAHRAWISQIIENGHLIDGYGYDKFPVFPFMIIFTSLTTGLAYKFAAAFSIGIPLIMSYLFIFLIGRRLFNDKVGLLSSLILIILPFSIDHAVSPRPISLAIALIPALLFIVIKSGVFKASKMMLLYILLAVTIALTHTVGAFATCIILFLLWVGPVIHSRLYARKQQGQSSLIAFNAMILPIIVMLFVWTFIAEGNLSFIARVFRELFTLSGFSWNILQEVDRYRQMFKGQYMLAELGLNLFAGLGLVGIFYLLSKKMRGTVNFTLSLTVLSITAFISMATAFNISGFVLFRWYPALEILLVIPAAIAAIIISTLFKNIFLRGMVTFILISVVAFFTLTNTFTNEDSPIYLKDLTSRHSFIQSEITARDTLLDPDKYYYDSENLINTDTAYSWYLNWTCDISDHGLLPSDHGLLPQENRSRDIYKVIINDKDDNNFDDIESGLVVIRKEIVDNPFEIGTGSYSIAYDPELRLQENFNRIYTTGTVSAYYK